MDAEATAKGKMKTSPLSENCVFSIYSHGFLEHILPAKYQCHLWDIMYKSKHASSLLRLHSVEGEASIK